MTITDAGPERDRIRSITAAPAHHVWHHEAEPLPTADLIVKESPFSNQGRRAR